MTIIVIEKLNTAAFDVAVQVRAQTDASAEA